jgi:hypothetical protein
VFEGDEIAVGREGLDRRPVQNLLQRDNVRAADRREVLKEEIDAFSQATLFTPHRDASDPVKDVQTNHGHRLLVRQRPCAMRQQSWHQEGQRA